MTPAGSVVRVVAAGALALAVPSPGWTAFERVPVGPEAAALGGVVASAADPVFGNPARAGAIAFGVSAWSGRPFGLPELAESQAGLGFGVSVPGGARVGVGLGLRQFGSTAWAEREARLVLALEPGPGIGLGVAIRGMEAVARGASQVRSLAVDLGFRVQAGEIGLGAVAEAVLGEVPGDPAGRLRRTAVGAVRPVGPAVVHLEIQRREDRPLGAVLGASLALPAGLSVRAGFRQDPAVVSWGFGLRISRLVVRASSTEGSPLGRTVRVGLAVVEPLTPAPSSP